MRRALAPALAGIALLMPARPAGLPASWSVVDHGARGGVAYGGPPVDGVGAVYVPAGVRRGDRLPVAFLLGAGSGAKLARELSIAGIGDQLAWQRTTPPFAMVVASSGGHGALASALRFARRALPFSRAAPGRTRVLRIAPSPAARSLALQRHRLLGALTHAFARSAVERGSRAAAAVAPYGWSRIALGPYGGSIWQGVIPNRVDPGHPRSSLVYLPPGAAWQRRYPALYLLHGLRGSPYSFVGGLRLAAVADELIHTGQVRPFVAVMPPAGSSAQFDGEWTGPWERYVVQDVVPWADRHLPLSTVSAARALGGFSAGGYGSVDIALRHPGLFGTVESWSGYYRAPRDGSLANATAAERLSHDPAALLRREAPALRAAHVRFFVSAGRQEPRTLQAARAFSLELSALRLTHVKHVTQGGHHGRTWRAILPVGVRYAFPR